jgi:starch synthase (maltosyl-transferring)
MPAYEQIAIADVRPSIDGGRYPVKMVVGDRCTIEATIFRHGHDRIRAEVRWLAPGDETPQVTAMSVAEKGLDLWRADLPLEVIGRHRFTVAAWTDPYASWVDELTKRVEAQQADIESEINEGLSLVERVVAAQTGQASAEAAGLLAEMRAVAADPAWLLQVAAGAPALALMARLGPRTDEAVFAP